MSTPSSKPLVRWPASQTKSTNRSKFLKNYSATLIPSEFAGTVGIIVSRWAHLEERMIEILSLLISDVGLAPARQIFRSVNSTHARIEIMRSLLQEAATNMGKGPLYDEIIKEFESLTDERNNYVHGLWWTNDKGRVLRANPSETRDTILILDAHPVTLKQAKHVVSRMAALHHLINLAVSQNMERHLSLPPTPSPPAGKGHSTVLAAYRAGAKP
jgi:hypothetical protein